ncbi:hypothetical protein OA86_12745 [Kaistella jeonii]|uniref:Uncharacterized protein n=1 Tax=Kaistella jeonii TaxID=266749 RepID=A0A0C1F4L8_9FLAO|nr:hypothetical protein OA86_12745 [Kaistella jeonii]
MPTIELVKDNIIVNVFSLLALAESVEKWKESDPEKPLIKFGQIILEIFKRYRACCYFFIERQYSIH